MNKQASLLSYDLKMAEQPDTQQTVSISQQLTLRSGVCSADIKDETDIVFKDKETGKITKAHKTFSSQASSFFNTWFKEQWQKEKATTEYPVPGDIDWEVFTNVISLLYGKEVQFEEEALPKIYKAADFLQLDNLKVVIVVSLTDQWELKDSSIAGAMCTAIVPHTDPRVVSGLLYMVSVRYLIRNIPTIVENDDIDISSLPFDTVMEIAQSEEVAAPEIELYHFLRKWTEKNGHKLTLDQTLNLFGHIRYATIPHSELKTITKYPANNNYKLWSAIGSCPNFLEGMNFKEFTNRKYQEGVLLLNSPQQKKWTTKIENASSPVYTIVSKKRECTIVLSWSMGVLKNITRWSIATSTEPYVTCEIDNLCTLGSSKRHLRKDIRITKELKEEANKPSTGGLGVSVMPPEVACRPSTAGLVIRTTPNEVRLELFDGTNASITINYPHPWLLRIGIYKLEMTNIVV